MKDPKCEVKGFGGNPKGVRGRKEQVVMSGGLS